MRRPVPNINVNTTQKLRDRAGFKQFVLQVNKDTFIYSYFPNTIQLNEDKTLFTLTLLNKKFIIDILELDNIKDYIDVYLFGVKQPQERYNVVSEENNIIVTFIIDITRIPQLLQQVLSSYNDDYIYGAQKYIESNYDYATYESNMKAIIEQISNSVIIP
jgi:hypothetical protein